MDLRKETGTGPADRNDGMSGLSPDNPAQRNGAPYWLIVRDAPRKEAGQGSRGVEILSLALASGRLLPIFRCESQAGCFIATIADLVESTSAAKSGWWVRGTGAGELISALSGSPFSVGPCAGVERVVLDPPQELVEELAAGAAHSPAIDPVGGAPGVSRGAFLEQLMGRGRPWFENGR